MNPANAFVALVHHPVYDKNRNVVATALTNLDLHDIARSVRSYGLGGFFIVHPVTAQRELAERIAAHWMKDGAAMNDFRKMAIAKVRVVQSIEEAHAQIARERGQPPLRVATCAHSAPGVLGYRALAASGPLLLLFGTGWGLTEEVMAECDHRLAPLQATSDYNHLSVRSACAIVLDRLYGDRQ